MTARDWEIIYENEKRRHSARFNSENVINALFCVATALIVFWLWRK